MRWRAGHAVSASDSTAVASSRVVYERGVTAHLADAGLNGMVYSSFDEAQDDRGGDPLGHPAQVAANGGPRVRLLAFRYSPFSRRSQVVRWNPPAWMRRLLGGACALGSCTPAGEL